jgi:hypothetical protein
VDVLIPRLWDKTVLGKLDAHFGQSRQKPVAHRLADYTGARQRSGISLAPDYVGLPQAYVERDRIAKLPHQLAGLTVESSTP